MGGDMPWPQVPVGNKDHTEAAVVIIGGGISGMCTAIDLIKRNNCRNFIILEKSGGLGGTWRDNKYPGCCCDVWSHLYSFSFEQNPDWTREYPGQEEILQYLMKVATKYELYRYVRFNTAVDSAKWDDAEKKWKTTVSVQGAKDAEFGSTYTITSDFLVSAVGQLNVPKMPDIPGVDEFRGKMMHSARWDWSYDLRGKKVAIIGNGATAAQIIPEIAKEVGHLTIHQRTPNWVIPRLDSSIPPWKRSLYKYVPLIRHRKRADMMDYRESFHAAVFDNASATAQFMEQVSKDHMHAQLPDRPDLWEKLQPQYSIGCKRVIISDDYFPVFLRDNVKLETGKIEKITATGIVTDGKEEEYDVIVMATGFRTVEFMHPIDITGSAGRTLSSIWKEGGQALYGVTVESLPNFAMLYGPNTNLGHNSIILMIEAQSKYINALIKEVIEARRNGRSLVIQPKAKRLQEYNDEIQSELERSSFADPNCNSWYKVKESGKITNNWSRTVVDYQKLLSSVNWSDYDLSGSGAEKLASQNPTYIGRVVEESQVSYKTMGLAALSFAAVGIAAALRQRQAGRLIFG
ncbi:flavin-binding monooxygenase [Cladophialophora carrionii]|uniref:Flavin-binding monooxygenase n=1 Tax=Cladophialophora carrionii TaxID=86049 RepID=A0A1C1C6S8_9EURO|nr:flavin-binding monooxygenase [Cladophialophora carrionii]